MDRTTTLGWIVLLIVLCLFLIGCADVLMDQRVEARIVDLESRVAAMEKSARIAPELTTQCWKRIRTQEIETGEWAITANALTGPGLEVIWIAYPDDDNLAVVGQILNHHSRLRIETVNASDEVYLVAVTTKEGDPLWSITPGQYEQVGIE